MLIGMLRAEWHEDGHVGWLYQNREPIGCLRLVRDWHEPGERRPRAAWVVEWMDASSPIMQRGLVELDAQPATSDARMAELSERAGKVVAAGPLPTPPAFGIASTGMATSSELRDRIELTSHALQEAEGRLGVAARRDDEHASMHVAIALTEVLSWVRALDEVMTYAWNEHLSSEVREAASRSADAFIARQGKGPSAVIQAFAVRQRARQPYPDWTLVLVGRGVYIARAELQGLRWLASKLLHFGPLPAMELRHWRAGEPPRWKWRRADDIFPRLMKEQQESQRADYDEHLAGRDVIGSLNLATVLIETEHLFFRLLREAEAGREITRSGLA